MLRGPASDLTLVADVDLPRAGVPQPEKRATLAGLALAVELGRVVRDRRAEIRPPRRLTVIAVGARVGQDIDAAVTDLDGQGVGVGVRGDAQVAVRSAVAPAPDLRFLPRAGPQQGDPGVGKPRRPLRGPARDITPATGQGSDDRAASVGGRGRPPAEAAEQRLAQGEQGWPAAVHGGVEEDRAAFVVVALAGWAQLFVEQGRSTVHHRAQPLPGGRAQRVAAGLGLSGGEESELRDETLVARGELAADARGESVADQLTFEEIAGPPAPALALAEPREGAAGHQLPGRFGDDVVVRR